MASREPGAAQNLDDFFRGVAQARYVIRRIVRIVEEQAKRHGLDPLEHQALLQLYGSDSHALQASRLAERLDVPAAVVSRLVKQLESRGLVIRDKSSVDRRVTDVTVTEAGRQKCLTVWEQVEMHVDYFQKQLTDEQRHLALVVFGFYVGVDIDTDTLSPRAS
jgi:DNA-binding MarR family transcriptional regulator